MVTPSSNSSTPTSAGCTSERIGTGPPVVLWHSLFPRLQILVGPDRRTGARPHVSTRSTDRPTAAASLCAAISRSPNSCVAAEQALDRSVSTEPVDWVGNAWGGHIGIQLAVRRPSANPDADHHRHAGAAGSICVRSWTKVWPLVQLYRFTGPNRLL